MPHLDLELQGGVPIWEQIVYAAKKAILRGDLRPGDPFPSVRELSRRYQVNPRTVQKAMAALQQEGLLEAFPGIGMKVRKAPEVRAEDCREFLSSDLEAIAVRARQLQLDLKDVVAALKDHWKEL
jgi:GntR family transcriptional regulator